MVHQEVRRHPRLPGVQRGLVRQVEGTGEAGSQLLGVLFSNLGGLELFRCRGHQRDQELLLVVQAHAGQEAGQWEVATQCEQLIAGELVVGDFRVPAQRTVPVVGGHGRLELHHGLGGGSRVAVPRLREEGREHGHVGLAQGQTRLIVLEVVVPVRQAKPTQPELHDVVVGDLVVGEDVAVEGRGVAGLGEERGQVLSGLDGVDSVQVRLRSADARRFDGVGVHVGVVVGGDLAFGGLHRGRVRAQVLDNPLHALLGLLRQQVEGAVAAAVCGDLEAVVPAAADVHEEVVAGGDLGVARREVQPVVPPDVGRDRAQLTCGRGSRLGRRFRGRGGLWRAGEEKQQGRHAPPRIRSGVPGPGDEGRPAPTRVRRPWLGIHRFYRRRGTVCGGMPDASLLLLTFIINKYR